MALPCCLLPQHIGTFAILFFCGTEGAFGPVYSESPGISRASVWFTVFSSCSRFNTYCINCLFIKDTFRWAPQIKCRCCYQSCWQATALKCTHLNSCSQHYGKAGAASISLQGKALEIRLELQQSSARAHFSLHRQPAFYTYAGLFRANWIFEVSCMLYWRQTMHPNLKLQEKFWSNVFLIQKSTWPPLKSIKHHICF